MNKDKIEKKLMENYYIKVENYLKLRIKPRPKWLPDFIWRTLLRRFVFLDVMQGTVKCQRGE